MSDHSSPVSEASTSDSNRLDTTSSGRSRSTQPAAPSSTLAFSSKDSGADAGSLAPTLRSMNYRDSHLNGGGQAAVLQSTPMSEPLDETPSAPLTLFAADSPAKTSRWLESVRDWLASGPVYGTSSIVSLLSSLPAGFSSRTSLGCFPPMAGETLPSSFPGWSNSGMAWPGGCLTLSTSEFPSDAVACSLSDVLETGPHLAKYSLSPRACQGILRRAEKRGKLLPAPLEAALRVSAGGATTSTATVPTSQ